MRANDSLILIRLSSCLGVAVIVCNRNSKLEWDPSVNLDKRQLLNLIRLSSCLGVEVIVCTQADILDRSETPVSTLRRGNCIAVMCLPALYKVLPKHTSS